MENETNKGKQKIVMKLIESERGRTISFSKTKKNLFQDVEKLATRSGEDVLVILFSMGGNPFSYASTSLEEIIEKLLIVKLEDRQQDHSDERSSGFEVLKISAENCKYLMRKKKRIILVHNTIHPGSDIPPDKHMDEQKEAMMLWAKNYLKETKVLFWESISSFIQMLSLSQQKMRVLELIILMDLVSEVPDIAAMLAEVFISD